MKQRSTKVFLFFFVVVLGFQNGRSQCVRIDPDWPVSSPCDAKLGYRLIFSDDCTDFNPSFWDKSSPGDDWPGYGDDQLCTFLGAKGAPMNESNVTASDGQYILQVRAGEDRNACRYSGAEIKTFNGGQEKSPARDWKMPMECYVEVRYRMPDCKGIGANLWLYGGVAGKFYEIGVNEQDPNSPDEIHSNIHFGPDYARETTYPVQTKVCNLSGNSIPTAERYLTFGMEKNLQRIRMYLNGVFFRQHLFSKNSPYDLPTIPLNIRLNVGSTTGGGEAKDCHDLPQHLYLDYVRVYSKDEARSIRFLGKNAGHLTLCRNNNCPQEYCNFVIANYLPGVMYEWEPSPFFTVVNESYGQADREVFQVLVSPEAPTGEHTLNLITKFPCGSTEKLPLNITVMAELPPAPANIALYTDDHSFFYAGLSIATGTSSYDWSINGDTYQSQPNLANGLVNIWNKGFSAKSQAQDIHICVRAANPCGTSQTHCQTITIPQEKDSCENCYQTLLPPREIMAEQVPNSRKFYLKVKKSSASGAYEWSFDQEIWTTIDNEPSQTFNSFGPIEVTPEAFMVYVRAQNATMLSEVYSQKVALALPKNTPKGD